MAYSGRGFRAYHPSAVGRSTAMTAREDGRTGVVYKQDHGGWICVRRSQGRPVAPDIPMRKSKMVMSMTSRMRWLLS